MVLTNTSVSRFASDPGERSDFAVVGDLATETQRFIADGMRRVLVDAGHVDRGQPEADTRVVLNFVTPEAPKAYRRRAQATFVLTVAIVDEWPADVLKTGYTTLVRSLSNMVMLVVLQPGKLHAHYITLEGGCYPFVHTLGSDDRFFERLYERLAPLALSHLVINNQFDPDLEPALWQGDEVTEQIFRAGKLMDALHLLPAPWPLQDLLDPRDFEHVKRLYGIGGLSHGNISSRKDATRFWMSASGVNKSELREPGKQILLVKGYDAERGVMLLSVPPEVQPRRVSVDAIEHWMIYTEHPEVGAILHVHAWIDGIRSTEINYPCGTRELAVAVAQLVREAPNPGSALIGLRNHGMTITGPSLDDIFDRIEGKVTTQVPMS